MVMLSGDEEGPGGDISEIMDKGKKSDVCKRVFPARGVVRNISDRSIDTHTRPKTGRERGREEKAIFPPSFTRPPQALMCLNVGLLLPSSSSQSASRSGMMELRTDGEGGSEWP